MAASRLGSGSGSAWAEHIPLHGKPEPLSLDLSALDRLDPLLLLRLAALLDLHQANDCEIEVRMPRLEALQRQLALMQVDCESELLGLPETAAVSGPANFLPVVRLSRQEQVDHLAEGLQKMLTEHFTGALGPLTQPLFVAFSELCDNATTHGENPHGAFVAANGDAEGGCLLAIGDLGIGIPAHIRRVLSEPVDDKAAIERAMEPGVSGAGPDRGGGYSGLFAAIEESKVATAQLRVWSATGRMTATFRHGILARKAGCAAPSPTDGTWVSLSLFPA